MASAETKTKGKPLKCECGRVINSPEMVEEYASFGSVFRLEYRCKCNTGHYHKLTWEKTAICEECEKEVSTTTAHPDPDRDGKYYWDLTCECGHKNLKTGGKKAFKCPYCEHKYYPKTCESDYGMEYRDLTCTKCEKSIPDDPKVLEDLSGGAKPKSHYDMCSYANCSGRRYCNCNGCEKIFCAHSTFTGHKYESKCNQCLRASAHTVTYYY